MATTKKINKKNTRKRGRRYMKKAARRTIAALLMITALIVAAIPATPGKAAAGKTTSYYSESNEVRYYFEIDDSYTDDDNSKIGLVLVGVESTTGEVGALTNIDMPDSFPIVYQETEYTGICTTIGTDFYKNNSEELANVTSFTASSSVKTINGRAFKPSNSTASSLDSGEPKLQSFTGLGVTTINDNAFDGCTALNSCQLSTSDAVAVGAYAFQNCSSLASMPKGSYYSRLGNYAFYGSKLGGSFTVIGDESQECSLGNGVFKDCVNIGSIEFSGHFVTIGEEAFYGCSGMTSLKLPDDYGSTSLPNDMLTNCTSLQNIIIPASVATIKTGDFDTCTNLDYIILQNNVPEGAQDLNITGGLPTELKDGFYIQGYKYYDPDKTIPTKAYQYCLKNNIRYKWTDGDSGEAYKYFDVSSSGELVNCSISEYLTNTGQNYIDLSDLSSVNAIDSEAFSEKSSIVSYIVVGDQIKRVENKAFSYFSGLDHVTFEGNTIIEDTGLSGGVFPSNIKYIYGDMVKDSDSTTYNQFEYAAECGIEYRTNTKAGTSETVNLYSAGNYALTGAIKDSQKYTSKICKSLNDAGSAVSEMYIPSGIESIDSDVFKEDTKIESIIMDGLKVIKDKQFYNCELLDSVELNGDTLSYMGELPFQGCEALHSMKISSSLFSCDDNGVIIGPDKEGDSANSCIIEALENYQSGTSDSYNYTVPSTVTSIREYAFRDNQHLANFYSNNGDNYTSTIDNIPKGCFQGCDVLKKVTIAKGIYSIGGDAFTDQGITEMTTTVYQPTLTYNKDSISSYDATGGTKYYFYSTAKDDSTYLLCNPNGKENDDNLIWKGLYTDIDPTYNSLSSCSIKYINGDTLDYTGEVLSWMPTDASLDGDFYVVDGSTILSPGSNGDYTLNDIGEIKDPGTYSFTLTGVGDYSGTLAGKFYVKDSSSSSSSSTSSSSSSVDPGPLAGCEILMYSDELVYSGETIKLTPVKSDTELSADGQFLVFGKDGSVLQYPTDYTFSTTPKTIRDVGDYVLTVRGKGTYDGGILTESFKVISGKSSSSSSSSSVKPKESTLSVNLILNGPDRSAVSAETYKSTNTFQYWSEGDPGIKSVIDKYGNTLKEGTDYSVQGYSTVKPGVGKNTGYVTLQFKGNYADEGRQSFFYDIKKDLSKNTSDDGTKSVTISVTEATIDSNDKIEATVFLTDSTTGTDLVKDTDYQQGSFKQTSGHHADVKITGKGDKYVGTYTYNFHMDEKKSSSSSGKSSSSSSKSSSGSSSMKSSSSSGTSGSSSNASGSGNRNSGTTVVNRNYYGNNGGTADELEDMLRAAHIDSINGGTADGYQVNITKSDEAERSFREALIRRYGSLDNIRYFSMDIDVKDENGNDIDTTGMSVTLTLPLPRSMEQYGTNNKTATVDSNGDLEDLNEQFSTLEGRPCVTFVAPHFSPYGFYVNTADLAIGTLDNTPKTGDPIHPKWFLSFGLAALSIFLFLKRDPKPQMKPA